MSRQYYDDPYGSSRRVNIQSRRNLPATPSDFVAHSSFQPNRQSYSIPYSQPIPSQTYYPNNYANAGHYPSYNAYPTSTRPSVNRVNYPTNDQAHRRYVLETPIAHTRVPQQQYAQHQSYYNNNTNNNDDEDDDNYYSPRYQSSRNLPTISRPHRTDTNHDNYPRYQTNSDQYNRRDRRDQPQPNRSYPVQSQRRSINVPVVRQSSTSSRPPMPLQIHHPPSLLAQFLYGIFGPQGIPFDDDDDDDDDANRNHSSVTPVDLIAFAWMGPDTSIIAIPSAIRIQFGDFLDLLAHDEPPAVGLSENEIEHIPITTYRKTSKSKSEEEKCAICLSSYKNGEKVKRLRCKHIFHPDCIDPWLKTSTQCPICRGSQST